MRKAPAAGGRPPRRAGAAIAVILAAVAVAVVAAYLPATRGPFVLDDVRNIVDNPTIRMTDLSGESLLRAARVPSHLAPQRPLAYVTFALNYLAGGLTPSGYHWVNILILVASLPVAFLALRGIAAAWHPPGVAAPLAAAAASLWALSPLTTNGVSYVVQRMTSLAALLGIASLALWLSWMRRGGRWRVAAAAVLLLGASATKENALLLPLVGLLFLRMTLPEGRARRWSGIALAAAVAGSQAGLLLFARHYAARDFTLWERLLTQGRVVARYLSLVLLPLPSRLNLDYDFPLSTSPFSPWDTLPAILLHALLIAGALRLARRRPLASFGILSFYLLQLMESTIAPLEMVFEHRAYLPSLFLLAAAADLLWWGIGAAFGARRGAAATAVALAAAAGVASGVMTWQRNGVWGDATALAEDIVAKAPAKARARNALGEQYFGGGKLAEARAQFEAAVRLDPSMTAAIGNLGVLLMASGQPREALGRFQEAQAAGDRSSLIWYNIGRARQELGEDRGAVEAYLTALSIDPGRMNVNYNIATIFFRNGVSDRAEAYAQRELAVNPGNREAASLLKVIRAQRGMAR